MIDIKIKLELHLKWLRGEAGGERLNLSGQDLSAANLRRANLSAANLSAANLSAANLSDANLRLANLSDANLSDANLSAANLSDADLSAANLSAANLSDADLRLANLSDANLSAANLDFSVWPLRCGSFHAKAGRRLFAQLLKHVAMLNVSECGDTDVLAAMSEIRKMPASSWFDEFRSDLAKTPAAEVQE